MKRLTTFILVLMCCSAIAQSFAPKEHYLVDSLELEAMYPEDQEVLDYFLDQYHQEDNEVVKIIILDSLVNRFYDDQWTKYNSLLYNQTKSFLGSDKGSEQDQIEVKARLANAISNKGYIHNAQGDAESGVKYYSEALEIFLEIQDTVGILLEYNNIGYIYGKIGRFKEASDLKEKHLKLAHAYGDPSELYQAYNNIGYDLLQQDYYQQSIENFDKAMGYAVENGDDFYVAIVYNNLGFCYNKLDQDEKALEYYYLSIELRESINRKAANISPLINIAAIYKDQMDSIKEEGGQLPQTLIDTTEKILLKGLDIAKEYGRVSDLATLYAAYCDLNVLIGQPKQAKILADSSYVNAIKSGYVRDMITATEACYFSYKEVGDIDHALKMLEEHIEAQEKLDKSERADEVLKQNYQLQYEVMAAADSIKQHEELKVKNAQIAADEAEKESLKKQKYFLFLGIGIVALFGVFMFNRFQVTRKQKNIIDKQREEVQEAHVQLEEHHNEIQDSIKYAKRIQEAIMPSMEAMNQALNNGFVLYLPKDVVAGDFFWMESVGDRVFFAAADCTGHGVPGAMVSVVCSNALTKALLEEKIQETGKLLDRTREIVIDSLARSGEEVKDGMDISLCALNMETKELRWAGANNPLWIIRKDAEEVEEYKPNKQPIGKYADPQPFTEHTIQLTEGDSLYVFTDGYQDQFGGPKGKKYKPSQLKKLLLGLQAHDMNTQKKTLHDTLRAWQGNLEQLDDICVIGVRI